MHSKKGILTSLFSLNECQQVTDFTPALDSIFIEFIHSSESKTIITNWSIQYERLNID
jgi:hypothetical protein